MPDLALKASLGCGNPTALAELKAGETVLDLGSGGGIDVLLSARRVGPTGKAYGLDMTDEMLALAEENRRKSGLENVEFLKGEIENIPLPDNSVDVIISNCVINLSGDKDRVIKEAFRVLKPGGRFAVSDVVVRGEVPAEIRKSMELWVGCVAGALGEYEYVAKLARGRLRRDRHRDDPCLQRRGRADVSRRRRSRRRRARQAGGRHVHQRFHPGDEAGRRGVLRPELLPVGSSVTKRVLILCTGNSARSQMAEGLLRSSAGDRFDVFSAGTKPGIVRPEAIAVMSELGIDMSGHRSKHVREFDGQPFDYVITVCDAANDSCPVFPGDAERIHWSLPDPAAVEGSEAERLAAFRRVRDALAERFRGFSHRSRPVGE